MQSLCGIVQLGGIRSNRLSAAAIEGMRDPDPAVRKVAIRLLGLLGSTSDISVVDALEKASADPDPSICEQALRTFGMISSGCPDRAIKLLETCLKTRHYPEAAVDSLGHLGPRHIERVSTLLKDA